MGVTMDNPHHVDPDVWLLADRNALCPYLLSLDPRSIIYHETLKYIDGIIEWFNKVSKRLEERDPPILLDDDRLAQLQIEAAIKPGCLELLDSFDIYDESLPQNTLVVCWSADVQ